MHYGLTRQQVRELAFEYANRNDKVFPESWRQNRRAGEDWFAGYMKRYPNLSLRRPEATRLSRATSFNKKNVKDFFDNLEKVMKEHNFSPTDIYNSDETGCTTVQKVGNTKVVACTSEKQVGKITSGERGTLVTMLGTINAAGNSVPPFLVFPRVHFKQSMLYGAPPGTVGVANPSGWMTSENFTVYMQHFIKATKCSKERPVLLILDNHESHISIETIVLAKDNGVTMLTLPPHCSHKMQPLDRSVYGPFKSLYTKAANDFMISHPGQPITIHNVSQIIGKAYPLAFTPRNINSGFKVSGIHPFDANIFSDEDFMCSYVTDRPITENVKDIEGTIVDHVVSASSSVNPNVSTSTNVEPVASTSTNTDLVASISTSVDFAPSASANVDPVTSPHANTLAANLISSDSGSMSSENRISREKIQAVVLPEEISPFPKAPPRKGRGGQKKGKTLILTDTPKDSQGDSSSEEEVNEKNICDDDDDSFEYDESAEEEEIVPPDADSLVPEDFVIVQFLTKKTKVIYIGQIIGCNGDIDDIGEKTFNIKFMRRNSSSYKFVFPTVDDISDIAFTDIIGKLPQPLQHGGTARVARHLIFPVDFYAYSKFLR
ncbi:uncharacterized protein LOC132555320 [Ylistrum balloti]|uniref:uncharacterized protein LOC132555320 n=1 Tax=Ylistrum balloti TaxID=509963 RepID=UPI0029059FD7|nr:uncharacterized protein LOC132555320 [Ylistrum balloti]